MKKFISLQKLIKDESAGEMRNSLMLETHKLLIRRSTDKY
jgi:hypothetical protein